MSIIRDIHFLEHIIFHCQRLEDLRLRFGDSLEDLIKDLDYKDAVILNIAQIGENIGGLSCQFLRQYDGVSWHAIKRFRNETIHRYKVTSLESIYDSIQNEMPELKKYCLSVLTMIAPQALEDDEEGPKPPPPRFF